MGAYIGKLIFLLINDPSKWEHTSENPSSLLDDPSKWKYASENMHVPQEATAADGSIRHKAYMFMNTAGNPSKREHT